MKKVFVVFLAVCLLLTGLIVVPENTLADSWKNESGKWLPPGIIKKIDFDWDFNAGYMLPPGLAKKYENSLQKIFEVKNLTRAQVAYILAEMNNEEYEDFDDEEDILRKVADRAAIPRVYRKAVAFVIDEDLMTCTTEKGKRVFQPNKRVTWREMYQLMMGNGTVQPQDPEEIKYSGYVRFFYEIGNKTWIAVETSGELRTAYFAAGERPSGLVTGIHITVEVDTDSKRIIESSLGTSENRFSHLTFSLKTNPSAPEAGEELTFIPQLVNSSSSSIGLDDVLYRFTIRRAGYSNEWEFTGSSIQDLTIPANNSSQPVILSAPTNKWTPPAAGDYLLVKAQLKLGSGSWRDVDFEQLAETRNYLTANQSSVETNTTGFASYGVNTFTGSTLSRVTSDKWQGQASLRVSTSGESAWEGVNVDYQGTSLTGPLTFSFYIKAPQDTPLRAVIYDHTNSSYPANHLTEFTASGSWQRKSVTFTPGNASGRLSLQITLNNLEESKVFYVDGLQLEKRPCPTTWVLGGSSAYSAVVVAP